MPADATDLPLIVFQYPLATGQGYCVWPPVFSVGKFFLVTSQIISRIF
jgi:hypothetical protein